jgi:antitoxin component YwqK of YwqJK toxin-antitoxin module
LTDKVTVEMSTEKIGTKSFTLVYKLYVKGELKTIGKSVLVAFDSTKNESIRLNEKMVEALVKNKIKKMYKITALIFSLFCFQVFMSQIPEIKQQEKCYEKTLQRKGQRFVDWECGKNVAIVDCNEKLDLDPDYKIVFSSATRKPFTGVCETCHVNGIIERRVTFVGGKEHGIDTTYYQSGCPMVYRTHIEGKENGQWVYYYDTTMQVAWEMNFLFGEKHGKQIYYSRKGDTTLFENYQNGVLHGVKKTYYSNYKIEKHVNYKKGLLHGTYLSYSKDGKVTSKLNYNEGKKDGLCTFFFDDGKLLRTENWSKDVKNGDFKTYFYQGHIQTSESFSKNLREGWFEERYPNQKLKRKALYRKDILIEEYTYDEQGKEKSAFVLEAKKKKKEDDEVPTGKKKKEKKKKESKTKK